MTIDRSAVNRALAKAIAYKQCGRDIDANQWAIELVRLLNCADILAPDMTQAYDDQLGALASHSQ